MGAEPRNGRRKKGITFKEVYTECHPNAPAILLANHGLLAFHEDPIQTARLIMEEAAGTTLGARKLGGEKPFPSGVLERKRERMARFESSS